ncbi:MULTISPECIES: hypothetical protein [unclassified Microbacterium]|uniref:hypothetical protein n=1 Tax=unclassified Microbacterium TaxID=2609290 RepID=UPI0030163A59
MASSLTGLYSLTTSPEDKSERSSIDAPTAVDCANLILNIVAVPLLAMTHEFHLGFDGDG